LCFQLIEDWRRIRLKKEVGREKKKKRKTRRRSCGAGNITILQDYGNIITTGPPFSEAEAADGRFAANKAAIEGILDVLRGPRGK